MKKLKYKYEYDSPPAFQEYAHDKYLGSTARNADDIRVVQAGSTTTPETKTFKHMFATEYAELGNILRD